MKKLIFALPGWNIAFCLFFGTAAFAEKAGGEIVNPIGDVCYTWEFDTDTGTLSVRTTSETLIGLDINVWAAYQNDIQHIVLWDDSRNADRQNVPYIPDIGQAEDITMVSDSDFGWTIDIASRTATMTGNGDWPLGLDYPSSYGGYYDTLVLGDGIQTLPSFGNGISLDTLPADTLVIGKGLRFDGKSYTGGIEYTKKKYVVSPENPYLAVYDDVLYTKDYSCVIACPTEKTSLTFAQGVTTIGMRAFMHTEIPELVIPWGVTRLEALSISQSSSYQAPNLVLLPDTIQSIEGTAGIGGRTYTHVYYPENNAVCKAAFDSEEAKSEYGEQLTFGKDAAFLSAYYPEQYRETSSGEPVSSSPAEESGKPESSVPESSRSEDPKPALSVPEGSEAPSSLSPSSEASLKPEESSEPERVTKSRLPESSAVKEEEPPAEQVSAGAGWLVPAGILLAAAAACVGMVLLRRKK